MISSLIVTTQLPFLVNLVPAIPLAVIMVTGIYTVPIDFRVLAGVGIFLINSRDPRFNSWGEAGFE